MNSILAALRTTTLEQEPFFGREAELQRLDTSLRNAALGRGGLILLEAESGSGKSRLLREFQNRSGKQCFWGQAKVNSGHRPFELLEGVIAGVVQLASGNSAFARHMEAKLGAWAGSLMTVFPALAVLFPGASRTGLGAQGEEASVRALVAFLEALGSLLKGASVILDDCQWSDELTMRLIAAWHSHAASTHSRLLLVAAYRGSELQKSSRLCSARPLDHIKLGPLQAADVFSIIQQIAGPAEPEVTALIEKLSHGNPFMVITVTRGFLETGILIEQHGKLVLQNSEQENSRIVGDAGRFLRKRIELLPAPCIAALKPAALLGKEFDLQVVAGGLGDNLNDCRHRLEVAIHRGIIQELGGSSYAFAHDKLREIVIELTSSQERKSLHLAIASWLADKTPHKIFSIAWHFDASGNVALALPYALAAAKEARARHSLEAAEHQYRIAWRAVGSVSSELRQQIAAGLGEVLLGRSLYDESVMYLRTARALTDDVLEKTRIDLLMGKMHTYAGSPREALAAYEAGLALLGVKIAKNPFWQALVIVKSVLVQLAHTVFPGFFLGRKCPEQNARAIRIADLYNQIGYPLYFECRLNEVCMTHFSAVNSLETYTHTPELCFSYAAHGIFMSAIPYFKRALDYSQRALKVSKAINDEFSIGSAVFFHGVTLLAASRYEEALHFLLQAQQIFRRMGYAWDEDMARCNTGLTLYRLGNLKEAEKELLLTIKESRNIQVLAPSLSCLAKLTGGVVPQESLEQIEKQALSADVQSIVNVKEARGIWHLSRGEYEQAITVLRDGWDYVRLRHITQEYVVAIPAWLATAMRMRLEAQRALKTRDIKEAFATAMAAYRLAKWFRNNLSHALRELGLLYALLGRERHAQAALAKSISAAAQLKQRYEHAQARLARGKAGLHFGWSGAAEELALATRRLIRMGAPCSFHGIARTHPEYPKADGGNNAVV